MKPSRAIKFGLSILSIMLWIVSAIITLINWNDFIHFKTSGFIISVAYVYFMYVGLILTIVGIFKFQEWVDKQDKKYERK